MQKITKVVIPVAGSGTRLLPVTKAQPKEMLPILNKPTIQYIVEDAVKAGIKDVILVTGMTKRATEDHFDRNLPLEEFCLKAGKKDYCRQIKEVAELANFIYIRQKSRYGNGSPVYDARGLLGDEPFAVVWGDEIIRPADGRTHLAHLIEVYEKYGDPVMTAYATDDEGTKKYGIIEGSEVDPGVVQIKQLVEKPGPDKTKSRTAVLGGYILTPDIFAEFDDLLNADTPELYLTEAIEKLMAKRPVYAKLIKGKHYDTGTKLNWLKTNIEFGLMDEEIKGDLKDFLKKLS